ncbi:MAG: membrane protein insertase YidC [Candidatus Omnitrophota bacterium]
MEKKLITAIALSILIIVTFQYFSPKPTPPPAVQVQGEAGAIKKEIEVIPVAEPKNLPEEKETEVVTGKYIFTFSNIGGSIKEIKLVDYKALDSKEPLKLVEIINPKDYIFNISNIKGTEVLDLAGYNLKGNGSDLIYVLTTKDFEIRKKYILRKSSYGIDLELNIKNISGTPKEFSYSIISGAGLTEKSEQDKRLIEASANINGKMVVSKRPKPGERTTNYGIAVWQALKNKYFSVILKPFAQTSSVYSTEDNSGNLIIGVNVEKTIIQPGESIENKYSLYAGPSSIPDMKEFGYGIEESVNYGFFGGISKILIVVMRMCHMAVRNWGLSIILLSVLLNLVTLPLTMKSFKSMQKMQELHPQMEKLKGQYKDQPQKLNKEIMELYKKYNINPFSGCLPILLQMPIFIALYQALMKSIELRNAGFLWIRDLSSPEAIPIPISLPIIGNTINILPLLMVGAMVVQQKISTASAGSAITEEQKQQQKIMLIVMPIMFGFIFYNMPSGLVLYWIVNTILTITEQASILRKEA